MTSTLTSPAMYVTAAMVALSALLWLALRRKWQAAAGWTALALAGQACALQLVWAGRGIRLQMFQGWGTLLHRPHVVFFAAVLLHAAIVLWGARKLWPELKSLLPRVISWPVALVFVVLQAYAATTIAPEFAQTLVQGSGFAAKVAMHITKAALGLLIFGAGTLNLVLAAASLPEEVWAGWVARWRQRDSAKLCWLAAVWVVAASSALAWLVLERVPHVPDESVYVFQAKCYAEGKLWLPEPPDREALFVPFTISHDGKWFASTTPGWPAALALGVWAGVPWLVNPLLGGIAILLGHALLRRVYDPDVADGATLLLAASPWLLWMSASLMPHPLTLALSAGGLLGVVRAREERSVAWGAVAGLCVGALLHVRPLEAVVIAAAGGAWWLGAGWKKLRLASLVATAVCGVAMTGLFLAYDKALTGDPMVVPINQYLESIYGPGSNRLGFGSDIGNFGWVGLDALPGHGPIDVMMNTNQNLYLVNFETFGWACGSLFFVFLLAGWREFRRDGLMWGMAVGTWAGLSLYWFSGGSDFGARYWYQMILPIAALTVRGAQAFAERMRTNGAGGAAASRVWTFVVLAAAIGTVNLMPWRGADKYYHYRGTRGDIRALERENNFGRSLVLIRRSQWPDYASASSFNPPRYDRDVPGTIYAHDLGPESVARLREYYADRPVWIIEGPGITGGEFRVVERPKP